MKVTACSRCGTKNPAGSKFCNNCAERLIPDTRQICPNCETPNPNHLLYCDNCGTLLAEEHLLEEESDEPTEPSSPAGRGEPFSLPSRPAGQTANLEVSGEIPDWLKTGEGAETEGKGTERHLPEWAEAAQKSGSEWKDEEAPTLDDVSGDHSPTDDLPVWLMDEDLPDTIFSKDKSTDELFEALGSETGAGKKRGTVEQLPEWLQGLASGTGPLPTLPQEFDSVESDEDVPAAEIIPGWLADLDDKRAESEATGPSPSEIGEAEETIPGWLADLEGEPADSQIDASPPEESTQPEETIPDWLANMQTGSPLGSEDEETLSEADAEEPPGPTTEAEVPDWLAALDTESFTPDTEFAAEPETEEDFPDWLASLDVEMEATESPSDDIDAFADQDQLPDWLRDVGEAEEPSETVEGEEASPWLQEADTEQPIEAELPDWLMETEAAASLRSTAEGEGEEEPGDSNEADWQPGEVPAEQSAELAEDERAEEPRELVEEQSPREEELAQSAEEEEQADWLRELGLLESDEPKEPSADTTPTTEVPEWLREMAPPQSSSLQSLEETSQAGEEPDDFLVDFDAEELPEWLTQGEGEPVEEPVPDEFVPTDELDEGDEAELPDWFDAEELAEDELSLSVTEETTAPRSDAETQPEETRPDELPPPEEPEEIMESFVLTDDLPEWLGDVMFDVDEAEAFAFDQEEEAATSLPPSAEVEGVPDTLAGNEMPAWLADSFPETMEGEIPAEPTPIDELPEWLRPLGGIENVSLTEDEKWSDLLEELPPPGEAEQELSEAEIPEWLRELRPRQLVEERESEELPEQAPESGPLAGIAGVIPIEPVIGKAISAKHVGDYTVSKEQQQQAALLQQLTRTVPQQAVQIGPSAARARFPLLQLLLAVLLLATMMTGFFIPGLVEPEPPAAAALLETEALLTEVAPRPVLVAFDYTPAMAGALDAQASLLLQEIAATGSPVLIVSQSAAGLTLAEQKIGEIPELDSQRIGYIPGGAVGLRRLASCLQANTTCERLFAQTLNPSAREALTESGLIVVIAGDPESLVSWIEQVATPIDKLMLAVVPQAVAPVAAPYYASEQLAGLLTGAPTALDAESTSDQPPIGGGEGQVAALALTQWLVVGLLLVGNLFYLFKGSLRRRGDGTA